MNESSSSDPIGAVIFLVWIAIYFYFTFAQYKIAQKVGHESPWMAFIPIVNIWQLIQMASKPGHWMFLLLIPFVNIYCFFVLWMETAKAVHHPPIWGALTLVPVINFISIGILAFGNGSYDSHEPPLPQERTREPEHVG